MDEKRYNGVEELRQLTYKDEESFNVYIQNGMTIMKKVVPGNTNLKNISPSKIWLIILIKKRPSKVGFPPQHYFILLMEILWARWILDTNSIID